MKKLQNNFTTPEQSKRLLELGVPADSADMLWDGTYDLVNGWEFEDYPTFSNKHYSYYQSLYREEDSVNILPCWSVGRLMEIFEMCDVMPEETKNNMCSIPSIKRMSYMEYMMKCFTKAIEMKILDFSKLEE